MFLQFHQYYTRHEHVNSWAHPICMHLLVYRPLGISITARKMALELQQWRSLTLE